MVGGARVRVPHGINLLVGGDVVGDAWFLRLEVLIEPVVALEGIMPGLAANLAAWFDPGVLVEAAGAGTVPAAVPTRLLWWLSSPTTKATAAAMTAVSSAAV